MSIHHVEHFESRLLLSISGLAPEAILPESELTAITDVAVSPAGAALVAGVVYEADGFTRALKAWRFESDGVQVGQTLTLDTNVGHEDISASIDPDGNAVVAYQKSPGRAYFVRISRSGLVSAPQLVGNPVGEDYTRTAAVSMDASGGFFLADIFNSQIRVHTYDAAGIERGPAFVAETFNPGGGIRVDVAAKPDGSGAVVAYTFYDAGALWNTRAVRVSPTAVLGGHPVNLADEAFLPSLAVSDDGSYVIGYKQFKSDPAGDTSNEAGLVRQFDASGAAQGQPIHLGTGVVTVDDLAGGGFVAVFSQDGVQYAQRFDASGAAIDAAPSPVTVVDFSDPKVAVDANGIATLVYSNGVDRDDLGPQPPTGPLRLIRLAGESIVLNGGVLTIVGTDAADAVNVKLEGSNILASLGTTTRSFVAAEVSVLAIHGLGGNDTITNETALKATLHGNDGNDTIFGGSGEDRIHGGTGSDQLWGRSGQDRIYGEDGRDYLYGNGGNDRIEGGAQPDHIRGNGGRDKLFGNGGNDRIFGGASGDWIYGQPGRDLIYGEGGNDRLYGDDGETDYLYGGAGDDIFITLDHVIDHLFGDGGDDTATADAQDVLISIARLK